MTNFGPMLYFQSFLIISSQKLIRGGSRTSAKSKMKHFAIIVHGWKPLTIIT